MMSFENKTQVGDRAKEECVDELEETWSDGNGEGFESPFEMGSLEGSGAPPSKGVAGELWKQSDDLVKMALMDPFVMALGQGTLPMKSFQAYVAEDAYFLRVFSLGYATAIERCIPGKGLPSMFSDDAVASIRHRLRQLYEGVQEELRIHNSYAASWGIDMSQHSSPAPATRCYCDFLKDILSQRSPEQTVASILSAMIPCLRLYAYIGRYLLLILYNYSTESNPYAEWIHTYACADYQRLPLLAEQMLDELSLDEPFDKLLSQYRRAMELEYEFFSSQSFQPKSVPINLLVVDFDDTCTEKDTTSLIAKAAIKSAVEEARHDEDRNQEDIQAMEQDGYALLQSLVDNYIEKRNNLLDEILPANDKRIEEFDMGWLGKFMDRISEFDREMNLIVVDSKILAGIKRGQLESIGSLKVPMRKDCLKTLKQAVKSGIPVAVVSVNWSAEMVTAALSQEGLHVVPAKGPGGIGEGAENVTPRPGSIVVYSNELEYVNEVSTGSIVRRCECAVDKARLFDDLVLGIASEGINKKDGVLVYVGDSMTDLSSLISADIGIVMGENKLIREVASAAGIPIVPLVTHPVAKLQETSNSANGDVCSKSRDKAELLQSEEQSEFPLLYEAESWSEINAFLFGRNFKAVPPSLTLFPPRVLSIAGSDSGGGAGIQADLKTCTALGCFGMTAVTALTAQNTQGVNAVHVPPVDFLRKQIRVTACDINPSAIKTGMLPNSESVRAVAESIRNLQISVPIVVDPVLVSTSGENLADSDVASTLLDDLFPIATVVTPNIPEASALLGNREINDLESMEAAARDIHKYGPKYVLLKGGHLPMRDTQSDLQQCFGIASKLDYRISKKNPYHQKKICVDLLYDGTETICMSSIYLETSNSHGTGCTLSTAIACYLAQGLQVPDAVKTARKYLWHALERSIGLPLGSGVQRPLHHGYEISDWRSELETVNRIQSEKQIGEESSTPLFSPRIANAVDLRVYAVTDSDMIRNNEMSLESAIKLAVEGGATVVQIREKYCSAKEFAERASDALRICRQNNVPLIVNDRVDVAAAIGADGVHVGQDDLPVSVVRKIMGQNTIIGVSVKTVEQARCAEVEGADYVGAGAIFETSTKSDSSVIGLSTLRKIVENISIPVVAIGGISLENTSSVIDSGADGVAVVSAIFNAPNGPKEAAKSFRNVVDQSFSEKHGMKTS